jgi:lysozyme family protein
MQLDKTFDTLVTFDKCYEKLLIAEGELSLDPQDKGNWTLGEIGKGELKGTKYGISAAMYPLENIRDMTLEKAKSITKRDYWDRNKCDEMPQSIVAGFFDMAFNSGERNTAKVLLQCVGMESVGVINKRVLDEVFKLDENILLLRFIKYRILFIAQIKTFRLYGRGWILRIAESINV